MCQVIQETLEDVGGGQLVDQFGAAFAGEIGLQHGAGDGGGGEALVPEKYRNILDR